MNTYPLTIINGCNFITWIGYESSILNGLDNGILNLHLHELNKDPTNSIIPMHA
jgi:hypothetical protein